MGMNALRSARNPELSSAIANVDLKKIGYTQSLSSRGLEWLNVGRWGLDLKRVVGPLLLSGFCMSIATAPLLRAPTSFFAHGRAL